MRVLVAEDNDLNREIAEFMISAAGAHPVCVSDGAQALAAFESSAPWEFDAVLLDIMMPCLDGYQVCESIRALDSEVAVVFLSAKGAVPDKREAFSRGADDYLVKPFDGEELLMRLEALQRRSQRAKAQAAPAPSETLKVGEFEFDSVRQALSLNGASVQLTPKEFQILYTLALKPETVMSKEELIEAVWGKEYLDDAISIAVYVRKIREKIEQNPAKPRYLKTAWGMGYSFSIK